MEHQFVSPEDIARKMELHNIPSIAVAVFSGFSPSLASLWLNGEKGLSLKAQRAVLRSMDFFDEVAIKAKKIGVPVNFGDIAGLQKLWVEFLRKFDEKEIVRTDEELCEQTDKK